jgi:hypothetical protein
LYFAPDSASSSWPAGIGNFATPTNAELKKLLGGLSLTGPVLNIRAAAGGSARQVISAGTAGAADLYFETADGTATARAFNLRKVGDTFSFNRLNEATGSIDQANIIAFDLYGNVGIGTATFEPNAFNGGHLLIKNNGGHPSTAVADTIQIYSADRVAGEAGMTIRVETNAVLHLGKISHYPQGAAVASVAAITATGNSFIVTGTADITSVDTTGITAGTMLVLTFSGIAATNGVVDGGNLKLSANLLYTPDDTLTLWFDGTNWREISRSVN